VATALPNRNITNQLTFAADQNRARKLKRRYLYLYLTIFAFAAAIYLGCIVSPPSLMDDVDAVQAQIARNMLDSGDWVTARLDGVVYLETSPLIYWLIAISYKIFSAQDWAARIPVALSAIGLCWLTTAFGIWACGRRAGFYAGLTMSTCVGLFLFTRILIPRQESRCGSFLNGSSRVSAHNPSAPPAV